MAHRPLHDFVCREGEVTQQFREAVLAQELGDRQCRALTATVRRQAKELRVGLLRPVNLAVTNAFPIDAAKLETLRHAVRLPRSRTDYERLLVAGRAVAVAIEEHAEPFMAAGITKEHATRIRASVGALEVTIVARSVEEQRRMAATQGGANEARRGAALVKLIAALVIPTLDDESPKVVEWRKAVRIKGSSPSKEESKTERKGITSPTTPEGTPSAGSGGAPMQEPAASQQKAA